MNDKPKTELMLIREKFVEKVIANPSEYIEEIKDDVLAHLDMYKETKVASSRDVLSMWRKYGVLVSFSYEQTIKLAKAFGL